MRSQTLEDEFPQLKEHGLRILNIRGDGNCLFSALSDQLYGHPGEHKTIRDRVIQYMYHRREEYKPFVEVNPTRRNPKRKNVGAYTGPIDTVPASEEAHNRAFDQRMKQMSRTGTFGDNLEIHAFSNEFNVNVRIWQERNNIIIKCDSEECGKTLHITYHTWEHYSSVRKINSPNTGIPNVETTEESSTPTSSSSPADSSNPSQSADERRSSPPSKPTASSTSSNSLQYTSTASLSTSSCISKVEPWMVKKVKMSLPNLTDELTIRKALELYKCDVIVTVAKLMTNYDSGFTSSSQESSSIERDADSDDEEVYGPNKRRVHRLSRAARTAAKETEERRKRIVHQLAGDDHQNAVSRAPSEDSIAHQIPRVKSLPVPCLDGDEGDGEKEDSAVETPKKSGPRVKLLVNPPVEPRRRLITARGKKELQKKAQKAARKERAQMEAKAPLKMARASAPEPKISTLVI